MRFYSGLAILVPQIYVVVEQCGAESIPLLSGRLVTFYHAEDQVSYHGI